MTTEIGALPRLPTEFSGKRPRLTKGVFSSAISRWETPQWVMDGIIKRWGAPKLDVAASKANAKAPVFFTAENDALAQDEWHDEWFLNPPYDDIAAFSYRAREEADGQMNGTLLVPARTDTRWWHDGLLLAAERVYFLKGRVKFELDGIPQGSAPFPSAVVRLGPDGGQPEVIFLDRGQWEAGW